MGEPNPDSRPRRGLQVRPARSIICRINLLDGNRFETDVDKKAVGQILFDKVCDHLDLLEKDYFGLSYIDPSTGLRNWLNVEKKISKQMKGLGLAWEFSFEVKFYPSDPQQLHEDLTRYQLCLQIRSDLVSGKLPATEVTYSLLGSYSVQSELGDFDVEDFGPGVEYIKKMLFAPSQDRDLLKKIAELHKSHKGKTPEEAELHFLENAKKLAMYGVDMFDCKDGDNVDIKLGICASGILVFRDKLQINKFVWPKILKMSYRRSKFYIKLRTGEFDDYQSLIAFKFLSSKHSKRIWKVCVEHHAFFRNRVFDSPSSKRGFMRFGSKFRYSGRSQFAAKQHVQAVNRPPPGFERTQSQIAKRSTFHGRTRHQRRDDDMFRPRPIPKERPPPRYSEDYIDRKPIPEPEIFDHENVFEDEESENRKNRMEKLNAVPTPLSVVMQKSNHALENNNVDRTPPRAQQEEDDDSIHKPPLEDDEELERSNETPRNHMPPQDIHLSQVPSPPTDSPKLLSKEERKRAEKQEKERKKREKEEEKRRKKDQEKERKRLEKEKKKNKGKQEIGKEWQQAVAVAETTGPVVEAATESRPIRRLSSFEDVKSDDKNSLKEKHDEEGSDKGEVDSTRAEEGETISDLDDSHQDETAPVVEAKEDQDNSVMQSRVGEEFDL